MTRDQLKKVIVQYKKFSNFLVGAPTQLSLENRMFNAICLFGIVILIYNTPFNYFSGLKVTSFIFIILSIVLSYLYWLARFKQRLHTSITLSALLVLVLFAVNYFFSAGIRGASLLSFLLSFSLIIIISPRRQYWLWFSLSLLIVLGLLWTEYHYPDTILVNYTSELSLFVDLTFAYIISITVTFISLIYLKQAYYKEKKSAEEKAMVLRELNNEKTKLFSIISHDLQAPLASLHSYMRLIRSNRLTNEDKEFVEKGLSESLQSTQQLLSNLLSWSQRQFIGIRSILHPTNIQSVLMPVIDIQKAFCSQKNILLIDEIDPDTIVVCDINMLQLVVRNLIDNAMKFTPLDGEIQVSARPVGGTCIITVKDGGIGISPERHAGIFTLKVQSSYGTNNEKGVGLGLFLCKEYISAQGGEIWFESELGKGTIFYISLPLADEFDFAKQDTA